MEGGFPNWTAARPDWNERRSSHYPSWQVWLRPHKPPTLFVWATNDPSFVAVGAVAFKRDLPDEEIHLLDADHFALDGQIDEIARLILDCMAIHPSGRLASAKLVAASVSRGNSDQRPSMAEDRPDRSGLTHRT
jgi:hypothetical protein